MSDQTPFTPEQKIGLALLELRAAFDRQQNREPAFKISIPARPDYDTDLVITNALIAAHKALDDLRQQLEHAEQEK